MCDPLFAGAAMLSLSVAVASLAYSKRGPAGPAGPPGPAGRTGDAGRHGACGEPLSLAGYAQLKERLQADGFMVQQDPSPLLNVDGQ